jgi:receptor protein-tyrosine kinase
MSIIERVADLLEPLDRPISKPAERSEPYLVERAISNVAPLPGPAEVRNRAPLEAKVQVEDLKADVLQERPAGKPQQIFRVDREHLRRQSIVTPDGDRTPNAESFRRIKRQILANVNKSKAGGAPSNLVLVTSALAGEGKTFCAVNLAISMALEMNRTVLLVDADVAKPSVPDTLGLKVERGLLDVLLDRRIDLAEVLCKTDIGKLTLLPAGTAHPHATELMASDAMRVLLQEMAERYRDRIIIFDSPPLLAASEAGVLASQMGQIVMVVEAGKTSEDALKAALARIETGNVTGLLLNKGQDPGLRYHYGEYGKFAK